MDVSPMLELEETRARDLRTPLQGVMHEKYEHRMGELGRCTMTSTVSAVSVSWEREARAAGIHTPINSVRPECETELIGISALGRCTVRTVTSSPLHFQLSYCGLTPDLNF